MMMGDGWVMVGRQKHSRLLIVNVFDLSDE